MKNIPKKQFRILAIAPTSRGLGFAVLEGQETLVDWGVRRTEKGDKNTQSLAKVKELVAQYQPGTMILQDTMAKKSRRAPRIKALTKRIIALAKIHKVSVKLCTFEKLRKVFFADGKGTKHTLAEMLAKRFPGELSSELPPKRKTWMSEDSRMDTFDAVALVLAFRLKKAKGKLKS